MKMLMLVLCAGLCGCNWNYPFARQQQIDRAKLGENAVNLPPPRKVDWTPVTTTGPGRVPVEVVKGTYTFSVPETVSEIKRTTNQFDQYALYMGQPKPADLPFMVITVSATPATYAGNPASNYEVQKTRSYILNGLMVSESSGFTKDRHYPFSEIVATRPGGGDKLQAMTVVPNPETREVALGILQSIAWEAAR